VRTRECVVRRDRYADRGDAVPAAAHNEAGRRRLTPDERGQARIVDRALTPTPLYEWFESCPWAQRTTNPLPHEPSRRQTHSRTLIATCGGL
jgi:hypothetical protein